LTFLKLDPGQELRWPDFKLNQPDLECLFLLSKSVLKSFEFFFFASNLFYDFG
jgi:hypothetical protein